MRHSAEVLSRQETEGGFEKEEEGFGFPAGLWLGGVRRVYFLMRVTCSRVCNVKVVFVVLKPPFGFSFRSSVTHVCLFYSYALGPVL